MVYNREAMLHFKNNLNCEIIHLKLNYYEFNNRIKNFEERGIINKFGLSNIELYNERIRLCNIYADTVINCDNLDIGFNKMLNK